MNSIRLVFVILVAIALSRCTDPNSSAAPLQWPLAGHWQFTQGASVDTGDYSDTVWTCSPPDSGTVHTFPYGPNLVITDNWLYTYVDTMETFCDKSEFIDYTVTPDRIIRHRYFATFLVADDTLNLQLLDPNTLAWRGGACNCEIGPDVPVCFYRRLNDGFENTACTPFEPPPLPTVPACTDYACDSTLPLILAFYDNTPEDLLDAGLFIANCRLLINGEPVEASPDFRNDFCRAFALDRDLVLLPRDIPLARPQNGYLPIFVQFSLDRAHWQFVDGAPNAGVAIRTVAVHMGLAGNFRVSACTGEQNMADIYDSATPLREVIREAEVVAQAPELDDVSAYAFERWVESLYMTMRLGTYNADTLTYEWARADDS
ncbi:MAG: hypothetical protein GF331_21810 [Chitinivibrionales bacterium]|nr:hypothetical protein [Chitinivibrionales bacterium]